MRAVDLLEFHATLVRMDAFRQVGGLDEIRNIVLDRRNGDEPRDSRFDDNYAFFRSQVPLEDVAQVWQGLQRLEHVSITLGGDANAQQIFESLNSTGEPLRDHELIHNYVLMGLTGAEQSEIEDTFWLPIEQNTGESIASFWRHYLVMTTGRGMVECSERSSRLECSMISAFCLSSRTAARRTVHTLTGSYVAFRTSTRPDSRPRRRCSGCGANPPGPGGGAWFAMTGAKF